MTRAGLLALAATMVWCAILEIEMSSSGSAELPAGTPAEGRPPYAAPVLVGVPNVQSGPSRSLGQNLLRGSSAYFDLVNGRDGIYGRKISILLKDDTYEPDPR